MVRLIDDLLDMSRINQGRIELRREKIDLVAAIQQAVEAIRPMSDEMRHRLVLRLPAAPIVVDGDSARLTQVVSNLLHNACKFTVPGGRIELGCEISGDTVAIHVRDTGQGIARDQLARVFDMFIQLDTSLGRATGGLGIGLTLVRHIVEMHAGGVEARSDGPGLGSEFVVRLPLFREAVAEPARPAADPETPRPTPRRILVVDDNHDAAASLAAILDIEGHATEVALDGPDALTIAERFRPDIVLLDIGLPGLSGYEVARRIRETRWGTDALLVALTGWGQAEHRDQSQKAGFDLHLVKPVRFDSLRQILSG